MLDVRPLFGAQWAQAYETLFFFLAEVEADLLFAGTLSMLRLSGFHDVDHLAVLRRRRFADHDFLTLLFSSSIDLPQRVLPRADRVINGSNNVRTRHRIRVLAMPICLVVFRLITISYLIGRSTGTPADFEPFKILSTYGS